MAFSLREVRGFAAILSLHAAQAPSKAYFTATITKLRVCSAAGIKTDCSYRIMVLAHSAHLGGVSHRLKKLLLDAACIAKQTINARLLP
jgi:hypothetical protein